MRLLTLPMVQKDSTCPLDDFFDGGVGVTVALCEVHKTASTMLILQKVRLVEHRANNTVKEWCARLLGHAQGEHARNAHAGAASADDADALLR